MNVLILGADGFLGRHVRAHLASLTDFEAVTAPPSRDLDLAHADPEAWDRLLDSAAPDVVVNCAGRTQGTHDELWAGNVLLVRKLVAAAMRRRTPVPIVHLGSAAEYGPHARVVSEDMAAQPVAPYGQSKLAGTKILLEARSQLPLIVLRVSNPVGAGQSAQTLAGRAALVFRQALEEDQQEVQFGDLSVARDFIDARDVAGAVATVARRLPADSVLNVGRGEAVSAKTLVTALARICSYTGQIREEAPGSVRSAGLPWQQADVTRLRRVGWAPAHTLDSALEALWRDTAPPPKGPLFTRGAA